MKIKKLILATYQACGIEPIAITKIEQSWKVTVSSVAEVFASDTIAKSMMTKFGIEVYTAF